MQELDTACRYDSMNRLTEERRKDEGEIYSYDPAGNRLKKQHYIYSRENIIDMAADAAGRGIIDGEEAYCYNERNELTEKKTLSAVTEYLYDENGSLVNEKEGSKSASYQYDLLNRQIYVKTLDGREQENFYDGEGLRAGIKEAGNMSAFLFKDGEILAECNGDGVPVRRNLQGAGLSYAQTMNDGEYHAYHQDEQGSTAYITGNAGTVENCYIYDAFGNMLESREIIDNRILYTGQQYDQETGQYYLRARFYNPAVGRFMQEDTYRGDGLNLYAYCANNPVIYYDPSGYSMSGYSTQPVSEPEKPNNPNVAGNGNTVLRSNVPEGYKQDANGRWHRPNGQFASNAEMNILETSPNKANGIHKNSLLSDSPNHVYVIVDQEGDMVKVGVSGQALNGNGTSPRANPQVTKFNQKGMDTHAVIVETDLSRIEALNLEQKITDKHAARNSGDMPSQYHQRPYAHVTNIEEFVQIYKESPNNSTGGKY